MAVHISLCHQIMWILCHRKYWISEVRDIVREKGLFYKKVFVLVLPMAIQNLINVGISSIDVIMLGKVGEKSIAGASLGAQVQFIMALFLFGITSGASVLMAQYFGKRDYKSIETVFGIGMRLAIISGIIFTVMTYFFASPIMDIFTNDKIVKAEGVKYLKIVCFSYLFNSLTMMYINLIRNLEKVTVGTVVYLVSMFVNIAVNYVLVFGKFGSPAMGIEGAAIGTFVARFIEFLIVAIYDQKINNAFRFKVEYLFRKNELLWKDFWKYSLPVIANEFMWGIGMSAFAAILGNLGSQAAAANSVAQVARNLAAVVAFGVSGATSIMIGNVIGQGEFDKAKVYGKRFIFLSIASGLLGGVTILAIRPLLITGINLSLTAQEYLSYMLIILSVYVVAQSLNTTLIVGIFRGGGDTKFGFFIDMSIMWGVSILFGFILAFVFKANFYVVVFVLLLDEEIKIPVTLWRYKGYHWLNNITR